MGPRGPACVATVVSVVGAPAVPGVGVVPDPSAQAAGAGVAGRPFQGADEAAPATARPHEELLVGGRHVPPTDGPLPHGLVEAHAGAVVLRACRARAVPNDGGDPTTRRGLVVLDGRCIGRPDAPVLSPPHGGLPGAAVPLEASRPALLVAPRLDHDEGRAIEPPDVPAHHALPAPLRPSSVVEDAASLILKAIKAAPHGDELPGPLRQEAHST